MTAAPAALKVSDHAVLRWMERTGVVDVEQIRHAIAGSLDRAWQASASIGQTNFLIIAGGLVHIVRDGVLVTVTQDKGTINNGRHLSQRVAEQG